MADDWARTIARHWLYETADRIRIQVLLNSIDREVAGLAEKIDREETYHRMHAEMWAERLRDEPAFREAVDELWPYALGVLARGATRRSSARRSNGTRVEAIERGGAHRRPPAALGGDDDGAPLRAGGVMVTAERVWEALAEIPDPEIPVLSLVDLGVVRDVEVDGERVHVGFTPTFLGCPALEVMRDQMAERIRELGAEPDVEVLSEGWSSDWITEEGHRKLRDSGFAPPSGRAPATLVQIQTGTHPCPYCGSTDTRLDNLFGPTPCRSIRYCNACRQPFEQFKTL